jgi:hypothetical protein
LAKLFPQHCQVPFLLWNENFQEVIDELTMTLNELPPKQHAKYLTMVFKRLQLGQIDEPTCTLTVPAQAWMLPREDIQLNPYVTPPIKQRVPLPTTTPMVHPTTGETISSYKRLMHDPDTLEVWQTAFGKDFGGMAQGDNKTGQKGTNSIFVMTHDEIRALPKNQTVTYAHVVVDFHPQKADPHRIRITAGGNLINFPR